MLNSQGRNQFDQIWQNNIGLTGPEAIYQPGYNLRIDKALKVLDRGNRLLDIGCGNGWFEVQAKGLFNEVYDVDIDETAVSIACQRGIQAIQLDLNVDVLPFPDYFLDVITLLSVLQYFHDMNRVFDECRRVLTPSGILIISVPNMRTFWRIGKLLILDSFPKISLDSIGYDGGTLHYFAFRNLTDLLNANNFDDVWAHGIFCLPRSFSNLPDNGLIGKIKRKFFSAEIFVKACQC